MSIPYFEQHELLHFKRRTLIQPCVGNKAKSQLVPWKVHGSLKPQIFDQTQESHSEE